MNRSRSLAGDGRWRSQPEQNSPGRPGASRPLCAHPDGPVLRAIARRTRRKPDAEGPGQVQGFVVGKFRRTGLNRGVFVLALDRLLRFEPRSGSSPNHRISYDQQHAHKIYRSNLQSKSLTMNTAIHALYPDSQARPCQGKPPRISGFLRITDRLGIR